MAPAIPDRLGALTLFVDDLPKAKAFYADVLGFEQVWEDANSAVFDLGPTVLNLLSTGAADALVGAAAVGAPGQGVRSQLTVWVEDTDAACDALLRRGVTLLSGPVDRPWGQRTASFADPAGHLWEVAQTLAPGT